jgi:hypothetical protein
MVTLISHSLKACQLIVVVSGDLSQEALGATKHLLLAVFCTTATKAHLTCSGKPAPVQERS